MAEAAFQRDRDEPEQPADPGGRQVDVRQQAGDGGQQPADPVRLVAKQRRAAQIQDGGKGQVGAEGHRIGPAAALPGPPRPLPPAGQDPGGQPPQPQVGPVHQPRDRQRLLGDQQGADQENEDARSGRQHEKQPGPHDEDAAADGEDFLVQPARPGLLPAVEVRLEPLAGRDRGELTPALLEGVEHGLRLHGMGERIVRQPRGAFPALVRSSAAVGASRPARASCRSIPLIRLPRPPEQEHPHRDDHRREHPGEEVQFRVAGANRQIARPDHRGQGDDHHRGEVEILDPGGVFHLADALWVHHPLFGAVGQQIGQGLGVAVGLLHEVGDEQRRGFHQGAGPLEVGPGEGAGVFRGQGRDLDLGQLPPQFGDVGLLGAGAGHELGGVENRQPERHQGGGDRGQVVHGDQHPAGLGVQGGNDGGAPVADAQPVDRALDLRPFEGRRVQGVEGGIQLQRRGFEQTRFQQPARQLQELALGLVFGEVEEGPVLPQQQAVERGLQDGGLAHPDRAGQQQVPALARLAGDGLHQVVAAQQTGDRFHSGSLP